MELAFCSSSLFSAPRCITARARARARETPNGDFLGQKIRVSSLRPSSSFSSVHSRKSRVVTMVIPSYSGNAFDDPLPDLASYLYRSRIVYLGLPLIPAMVELMFAQFIHLQYENSEKPIYLYINSTGTVKGDESLGYETEAFALYDLMNYINPPIFTLCVGNAWGDAALLLTAGAKGNRAALPSATIMIREPLGMFEGQAVDADIAKKEMRIMKDEMVSLLSKHTGKPKEQIEEDIKRPKYFSPTEAIEYGLIDKVLYNEGGRDGNGVVSQLQAAKLI